MDDTTASNQATDVVIPLHGNAARHMLAFLIGTIATCLVAAFGVGVLIEISTPDIPGESILNVLLIPLYAVFSLMFIVPLVLAFGVPYAALLLAFGRFRFWPMTLGGFVIAGGPALVSAAAMHAGISGSLVEYLGLLGMGAVMLANVVPSPATGFVLGLLGALGAAAFHFTYRRVASRR